MKILLFLAALIAFASAQFGFGGLNPLGGGGGSSNSGGSGFGNTFGGLTSRLQSVANAVIPGFEESWASHLADSGRQFVDAAEEALRKNIFKLNAKTVLDHNKLFEAGKSSYELGLNLFADLKPEEIAENLNGRRRSAAADTNAKKNRKSPPRSPAKTIPDSFDWREKGAVTPVKFQGLECGACWSFAVTGAIEGHYFRKTGKLIPLSEQNLIDCSENYGNTGCDGGYQEYGFDYVLANGGIDKAEKYPFLEKTDKCKYDPNSIGATIQGYSVIEAGNEAKLKEVIATLGPVAVSVNAGPDSFVLYKSGVYKDAACNEDEVNHSVLVVGYGTENGEDYWLIKNSWTEKWGEKGFMKLARNANNFCGVASEASYPIV